MASPIKATPILRGKDALNFEKKIEENKNKPVSKEELERIKNAFNKFNFKCKF